MVKTIKDVFPKLPKDDGDLAEASDELWKLGDLEQIKKQVSPDLFTAHVVINMVGIYQCDGWENIISYYPGLFPYIPQALDILGQPNIKAAFQNVIALFPDFVPMHNGGKDERFNRYSKKERAEISKKFNNRMEILDKLSDPLLKWDGVFNFIKVNYNA